LYIIDYFLNKDTIRNIEIWKKDIGTAILIITIVTLINLISGDQVIQRISLLKTIPMIIMIICFMSVLVFIYIKQNNYKFSTLIVFVALINLFINFNNGSLEGFRIKTQHYEKQIVDVCNYIRNNTKEDACFIIPPDMAVFQYYSNRSAFVSFKHLPPQLNSAREWLNRLKLIHVIPKKLDAKKINSPVKLSFELYDMLSIEDYKNIKKQYGFVEYCLVRKNVILPLLLIYENDLYKLYSLK